MSSPPDWRRLLWRRLRVLGTLVVILVVLAGSIYLLAPQWVLKAWQWQQAGEAGLQTRNASIDGQTWTWYEGGSGPTLVLLHGFGGSRHDWVPVAAELTGNFHLVIPDLPGWGDSPLPADAKRSPEAEADRLAAFLTHEAPGNIILIGHSWGALVAGLYAADNPANVAALGFVDAFGVGHLTTSAINEQPLLYHDRPSFKAALALAFATTPELPGRIADVYIDRNKARMDDIRPALERLQNHDAHALEPVLPRWHKPALVIWCHDDKLIDVDAVDVFRQRLTASPRIDVTTLFGCSHMAMREKPRAMAQAITRFLLPVHRAPAAPLPTN